MPRTLPQMGFRQFVALIAAIMAINALAIDSMLPALPAMAATLHIADENGRQWIVTAYLLGFGVAQILYGTLADAYGRKPVLLAGLGIYIAFSLVASLSISFEMMMAARAAQGIGAAASRVLAVSIVRDRYAGRQMARVMSLSLIVFLAVPIFAPSIGQAIMLVAAWRWIFGGLTLFGMALFAWIYFRLPETMHPENRTPISLHGVAHAMRLSLTNRASLGYMLAITLIMGSLFGFLNSAQQIFSDVFAVPRLFPLTFASIALGMVASSFINAHIVERLGTRIVSHSALSCFILLAACHALIACTGHETLLRFALLQAGIMFCFGLMAGNFNAMAMEPLGHIAGTAASVQGFFTTVLGALIGFFIGQHFNGSVVPLILGFLGLGAAAMLVVFVTEKGKLFRPSKPLPEALH